MLGVASGNANRSERTFTNEASSVRFTLKFCLFFIEGEAARIRICHLLGTPFLARRYTVNFWGLYHQNETTIFLV